MSLIPDPPVNVRLDKTDKESKMSSLSCISDPIRDSNTIAEIHNLYFLSVSKRLTSSTQDIDRNAGAARHGWKSD